MLEDRIRIIKRGDFDQTALHRMAEDKLRVEMREFGRKIKEKEKREGFVYWIAKNEEEFSYIQILALVWLYKLESERREYQKQKKYWRSFLVKSDDKEFSEGDVERARSVPVEDLIGGSVKMAGGGRVKALCPFHDEDSASFVIYPDNSWHCFGCGAHGNNAIDFVMRYDKVGFREALKRLS